MKREAERRRRETIRDDCISEGGGAKSLSFRREEPQERKPGRRKFNVFADDAERFGYAEVIAQIQNASSRSSSSTWALGRLCA